jgi:N-acetylglucosaminyl-diphospho-decaprenol L-rhamnosyltransferase
VTELPALALAVITHNSAADLRRCLPGQLAAAAAIGAPVVIVDNASVDQTAELLRSAADDGTDVTVYDMGRNAGYAAAVNAAFARAPGRDVMLLNPDVEVAGPEVILALAGMLEREPTVGVVAPRLVGDDGAAQPSARRFPSLAAMVGSVAPARRVPFLRRSYDRYTQPSIADRAVTVDWVIGAAMLIRRNAFEAVGGWDERFFLYIEDTDFCRRCARAGWDVVYMPSVVLRHRYPRASSGGTGPAASPAARRSHVAGLAKLWARDPRLLVGRGGVPPRVLDGGPGS